MENIDIRIEGVKNGFVVYLVGNTSSDRFVAGTLEGVLEIVSSLIKAIPPSK